MQALTHESDLQHTNYNLLPNLQAQIMLGMVQPPKVVPAAPTWA